MRNNILLIVLLFASINVCFGQTLLKIDIESILDKKHFSNSGVDYIEEIEFIPLQTAESCLIGVNADFSLTNNYIIVRDENSCFLFNRKTGKFEKKIGNKGRGPGEYRSTMGFIHYEEKMIYFSGNGGELLQYNFSGDFIKKVSIPGVNNGFTSPSLPSKYTYTKNFIVSYFGNMVGTEEKLLSISDHDGNVVKLFPNKNRVELKSNIAINLHESQFYHMGNELYFKEDYSDIVYNVSTTGLRPYMILHLGKYQPFYESKWYTNNEIKKLGNELIGLRHLIESKNFVFFEFYFNKKYYQAVFNKNNKKLSIEEKHEGFQLYEYGSCSFYPISNILNGYVLGFVDAYKIVEWYKHLSDKAEYKSEHLQKLKQVKVNDNPVLMLVKLKE